MSDSDLHPLARRAEEALRAGDPDDALAALEQLEALEPDVAAWPRRRADVLRRLGDRPGQQAALERCAELYASAGMAVQAIAICRLILAIDPGHRSTQEMLARLAAPRSGTAPSRAVVEDPDPFGVPAASDAPLEEIWLTQVVPESLSTRLTDEGGEASEIRLDAERDASPLDLGLTDSGIPTAPVASAAPPRVEPRPASDSAAAQLAATPLFGELDPESLEMLIAGVRVVEIAAGETLFRQGDPADALYVVADGAVVPVAETPGETGGRTRLAVLEAGEFFGEIGLVTRQPRNATIEALVDTRLLAIDRRLMWRWLRANPARMPVLLRFLRQRLVDRLVRTSALCAAFARADRERLASGFRLLEIGDGTAVIEQGQPSGGLFVVLAGRLQVIRVDTDGDKVLADLDAGALCGERSLLLGEPAGAAVVASGKAWLLQLESDRFREIVDHNPRLQQVIEEVCSRRERENETTMRQAIRSGDAELGLTWPPLR